MSPVGDPTTWSHAPVKISPHTFSAIEIAVAIGVSVFGAAWYAVFFRRPCLVPFLT